MLLADQLGVELFMLEKEKVTFILDLVVVVLHRHCVVLDAVTCNVNNLRGFTQHVYKVRLRGHSASKDDAIRGLFGS